MSLQTRKKHITVFGVLMLSLLLVLALGLWLFLLGLAMPPYAFHFIEVIQA